MFEKLFSKQAPDVKQAKESFRWIEGYRPVFRDHAGGVYESELIRAALDAHARHAAKLKPEIRGSAQSALTNRLKVRPNEWQTWPKFLYQANTILMARNNLFIVPVLDGRSGATIGLQNICPERWELVRDENGKVFVRFYLPGNKRAAMELERVGIVTRYQFADQLFGENNYNALKDTLDLISVQKQGIRVAVENGASYRFIATMGNFAKDEDLAKERKRFDRENFSKDSGGGGVLIFPAQYKEVKQIDAKSYSVDADQQKLIENNIFNFFGVNESILQNKAYGDDWMAFYEGATEWFALNMSEAISTIIYTERERKDYENSFFLASNRLQYMSTAEKLNLITNMADRGGITRNEMREILNLDPLPAPYGDQIPARGEYYNVNETAQSGEGDE